MDHLTGIYEDIPEGDYFALPGLSQSSMRTLLDCPARFQYERENGRAWTSDAAEFGSVVHRLLLGEGSEFVVIDAEDWRTKAAQEQRNEARAAGLIPLLAKDAMRARLAANAAMENPEVRRLMEAEGDPELTVRWSERHGGLDVPMRGRLDKVSLLDDDTFLVDVKTTRSAAPRDFARSVFTYGYALQQVTYQRGWNVVTDLPSDFVFVVIETVEPFLSAVYRLDETALTWGRREFDRALRTYVECETTGVWPGYASQTLESPSWVRHVLRQQDEADAADAFAGEGYEAEAVWG